MDRFGLNEGDHRSALTGLGRLNFASGISSQLCNELVAYSRVRGLTRLRVLDVASGGGDVALRVWKLARKRGLRVQILGLDISPTACQLATERSRAACGAIEFAQCDVVHDSLPDGFDVVTCSLFLHHLAAEQAADLLKKMAAGGRVLLVNDLRRCAAGYLLAQLACHTLTRSRIVRSDGPQSVVNAFTLAEMRELCVAADLRDATVRRSWPCRMMVRRHET